MSHSHHLRKGGLGFLLNRNAQAAWCNAGEYIKHRDIDGVTRISSIQLSYKSDQHTRYYHIINTYFPTNDADKSSHDSMSTQLSEAIEECPSSAILIIGGDINAWIGTKENWEASNKSVGKFGISGINERGENLMQLLLNSELKATSTFFQKKSYATYRTKKGEDADKSFDRTYDHFFVREKDFNIVRNCKITDLVDSDHRGISIRIYNKPKPSPATFKKVSHHSSKAGMKRHTNRRTNRRIIWQKLYDDQHRLKYNTSLTALLTQCNNINHSSLSSAIQSAASETLTDNTRSRPDWFQLSREKLTNAIRLRDIAMKEFTCARTVPTCSMALEKLRWARKWVKSTVKEAKKTWIKTKCNNVERGSAFKSWAAVKDIKGGFTGHYSAPRQSKLMKEDGTCTKTDAETGEIFCRHFEKSFQSCPPN